MKSYTMESRVAVANEGTEEITRFLKGKKETLAVINIEDDNEFRKKDIDLIWVYKLNGKVYTKLVEVKVDTYARTGNYFIETVSNAGKGTQGCFLYTEADYLFYYFLDTKELNIIPMDKARTWFIENKERFKERVLKTDVGRDGYQTKGSLVPRRILNKEVPGVKTIEIKSFI